MSKSNRPVLQPRVRAAALAAASCAAALLAGCALTPTQETTQGYAVFDVKGDLPAAKAADALKTALQKNMTGVQISHGLPPSPLPDKAGRFKLVSPFAAGSGLAALAARSGQSIQVPMCDGAIVNANGSDNSYGKYGEATTFFACLMPYQGGYGLNIVTTFSKASGGFNPAVLGATLARAVTGDSSQFIPRTIKDIVDSLKSAGATVTMVETYP